jgi:hypothetical protein
MTGSSAMRKQKKSYLGLAAALSLGILAAGVNAQSVSPDAQQGCTINPITFRGWPAQEMTNAWVDLVFVPELGGRLMQVIFGGHPYLFVNPEWEGKYIPPDQAAGRWINYGGDKIWPLPEGNDDEQHWTGASTPLDDGAYQFSVVAKDAARCTVRLDGPPDPPTGLQYAREVSIGADSPDISFHSITKNYTGHSIAWSVQSVSQYDLANPSGVNGYNHDFWAITPVNPDSGYLLGYRVRDGLANDPSFSVKGGLFRLNWKYIESEVWVDSNAGWVAVVDGASGFSMVEKTKYVEHAEYPSKASVIFYKNGPTVELDSGGMPYLSRVDSKKTPYYMEAELNSPMAELGPGETYTFDTHWFPCRMGTNLHTVTEAGAVGKPLTVTRKGKELRLTGQFGAFFPGTLEAHLYDRGGTERAVVSLGPVTPKDLISLQKTVPAAEQIARVSLHLVDAHRVDRGALGEVFVIDSKATEEMEH